MLIIYHVWHANAWYLAVSHDGFPGNQNRNRNLKISKALFKSQAQQSTSLFTNLPTYFDWILASLIYIYHRSNVYSIGQMKVIKYVPR